MESVEVREGVVECGPIESVETTRVLTFRPSDKIILECPGRLSKKRYEELQNAVRFWSEAKEPCVLLLQEGIKAFAVRMEDA